MRLQSFVWEQVNICALRMNTLLSIQTKALSSLCLEGLRTTSKAPELPTVYVMIAGRLLVL